MNASTKYIIVLLLVTVVALVFHKVVFNRKFLEGYKNGDPLIFPSNYCPNKSNVNSCTTDWKTDGYITALTNNGINVAGNPCTYDNSACSVSQDASGWNYQFTGPAQ